MLDNTLLKTTMLLLVLCLILSDYSMGLHPLYVFILMAVLLFRLKPKITLGLASLGVFHFKVKNLLLAS